MPSHHVGNGNLHYSVPARFSCTGIDWQRNRVCLATMPLKWCRKSERRHFISIFGSPTRCSAYVSERCFNLNLSRPQSCNCSSGRSQENANVIFYTLHSNHDLMKSICSVFFFLFHFGSRQRVLPFVENFLNDLNSSFQKWLLVDTWQSHADDDDDTATNLHSCLLPTPHFVSI